MTSQNEIPDLPFGLPFSELPPMDELLDDDPAPKVPRMKYHVIITGINSNRFRIARLIAAATGVPLEKAMRKIIQLPADIAFRSRKDAERLAKAVSKAGAKARIETS